MFLTQWFASDRECFVSGQECFTSGQECFAFGQECFASGRECFASGQQWYAPGQECYASSGESLATGNDWYTSVRGRDASKKNGTCREKVCTHPKQRRFGIRAHCVESGVGCSLYRPRCSGNVIGWYLHLPHCFHTARQSLSSLAERINRSRRCFKASAGEH